MDIEEITEVNRLLSVYFNSGRETTYSKGEVISGGEKSTGDILFLSAGFAKGYIINDDGTLNIIVIKSAYDLIGHTNLFTQDNTTLYYEAMSDMTILCKSRDEYEAALIASNELTLATLKKAILDLRDTTQRLENLNIVDARERLIFRLLFLARRFGEVSTNGNEVMFVPMTYTDLADSIHLSRETVNRIVRQLVEEGLVTKSRGHIKITDRLRLESQIPAY